MPVSRPKRECWIAFGLAKTRCTNPRSLVIWVNAKSDTIKANKYDGVGSVVVAKVVVEYPAMLKCEIKKYWILYYIVFIKKKAFVNFVLTFG